MSQIKSEIDPLRVGPSRLLKLHQSTWNSLAHFITKQEAKNLRLKKRIHKLEEAVTTTVFLMTTISI